MDLKGKKIGLAMTGSFCTFSTVIDQARELLKRGAEIVPIMSFNSYEMNTRFGTAEDFINIIEDLSGRKVINTIQDAEPIGPKHLTDIMLVAPCSGNTISKIANNVIDTPVTMAIKSHLRNEGPVVIAVSTNDGLAASAENIGKILNRKHFYFVPFKQDNPITKPRSLVFDANCLVKAIEEAFEGHQMQPIITWIF